MKEAKFVSARDVHKEAVARVAKSVAKFEVTLLDDWRKRAVFTPETVFDAAPLGPSNIAGVGIGQKITEGVPTGEMCMKVYVVEKAPEDEVEADFIIPEEFEGEPTDVEQVGIIQALPFRGRYRPAPGGVSIGHVRITAGTLGCFCRAERLEKEILILSNNHVLANENDANIGDAIVQPGPMDGGRDLEGPGGHRIATLLCFVPIEFGGNPNLVDAALGKPTNPALVKPEILQKGRVTSKVTGAAAPALNTKVWKSGRTTQYTKGVISGVGATVRVGYDAGIALFRDQVIVTPGGFSAPGDSGSAILDSRNRVRALLFAGSTTHTIGSPVQNVLQELSGVCELGLVSLVDD